ncbi:MAG: DUF2794 domain-containing protein [Alphaproteobacteria bacterium]|nr:DUF2794 domain-containing protein [Alphaproteobacteria bacterium]
MSDTEPVIVLRPGTRRANGHSAPRGDLPGQSELGSWRNTARFDRRELSEILSVYGRKVAEGEWRDYAIDMGRDKAVFSVFRRSSEFPFVRIVKDPRLARRQGAYSVVAAGGHILKRGHDLRRVLSVLEKSVRVVR